MYFGTFPGANGIYSDGLHPRASEDTPGFTHTYKNLVSGETETVELFLIDRIADRIALLGKLVASL